MSDPFSSKKADQFLCIFCLVFTCIYDNILLSHLFHIDFYLSWFLGGHKQRSSFVWPLIMFIKILGCREDGLLHLFDYDFKSGPKFLIQISSIVTIWWRMLDLQCQIFISVMLQCQNVSAGQQSNSEGPIRHKHVSKYGIWCSWNPYSLWYFLAYHLMVFFKKVCHKSHISVICWCFWPYWPWVIVYADISFMKTSNPT